MSTKGTGRETPETEAGRKPNGIYCDYVHWTTCARIEKSRDALLAALKGLLEAHRGYDAANQAYWKAVSEDREADLSSLAKAIPAAWEVLEARIAESRELTAAAEPKAEGKG